MEFDISNRDATKISDVANMNDDGSETDTMGNNNALIRILKKHINRARSSGEWFDVIELNFDLGDVYTNMQSYKVAKKLYSESMELSQHFGDRRSYSIACYKLAEMFATSHNINDSLICFLEFLRVSQELDDVDEKRMCEAYYHISKLYTILGETHRSLEYCKYYSTLSRKLIGNESMPEALVEIDILRAMIESPENREDYIPINRNKVRPAENNKTDIDPSNNRNSDSSLFRDQILNQKLSWHASNREGIQLYHMKKYHKSVKYFFAKFPKVNHCDTMASNMEFNYWKAESLAKIGACLRELKQYKDAINYFKKILDLQDDIFNSMNKFAAYCQLEACYKKWNKPKDAEEYTQKKVQMMIRREWSLIPKNNLAEIYYYAGDYLHSWKTYQMIVEESQLNQNRLEEFLVYCNIGHVYFAAGCIDDAFGSYKIAKIIATKTKQSALASVLYNLYQIYRDKKDLDSARKELLQYLDLSHQIEDDFGECLGYKSMSDLLEEMKNYKESYEFAAKHLECAKTLGDELEIMCAQKNLEKCRRFLEKSLDARLSTQSNKISSVVN